MRKVFFWFALFGVVFLSACAPVVTKPTPVENPQEVWRTRQLALQGFNHWNLTGQVGVVYNQQAGSANVSWTEAPNGDYQIDFYGPLGLGSTQLKQTGKQISLVEHNGQVYQASTPEVLMFNAFGWAMPIEGLVYWIRGLPVPNLPYHKRVNQYGTLGTLSQQGWLIQYIDYQKFNNEVLPTKLRLQRDALTLTIVIDRWK